MSWVRFFGYFLIFQVNYSMQEKKSPNKYFNICRQSDPKLGLCIQRSLQGGLPHLLKGIPEINLPSIDPMYLQTLNMTEGSKNFKLVIVASDIRMSGFRGMTVENFKMDVSNLPHVTIKGELKVPYVVIRGKYILDGKVLVIPVQGNGNVFVNATHSPRTICTIKGQVKLNSKDNKKYLKVDTFDVYLDIKKGKIHFTNLFSGNKILGIAVNQFFNDHFYEIFDSLRHLPQRAFGQAYKDYVNIFFRSYPFDELLLP